MALDPFPGFSFFSKNDRARTCFVPTARLFRELASGEPPATTWVFPNAKESDHPLTDIRMGTWPVTGIVNVVMKSPCWRTTVLVVP
jgi:phospholipase C